MKKAAQPKKKATPPEETRAASHYRPADERRAAGKELRQKTPRMSHGTWAPPEDRRDPLEVLQESNRGRLPELIPIRFGRMVQSPFAFYRGSAAIMAADLAATPASGIRVQACGDAHLANFGAFATPERRVIFDINDFDETLPAPWEWDLKRLAASIILAGRHIRLPESDSERAAQATVRSYREHMADYSGLRALEVWYDTIDIDRFLSEVTEEVRRAGIEQRLAAVRKKNTPEFLFPKLAEVRGATPRILDDPPLIFHPTAEQAPGLESRYQAAIAQYRENLPEHVRTLLDRFHFSDLAIKAVGVGSVGTRCAVALFMADDDDPLFLQVKEAVCSVLEPYAGKSLHASHGERVVVGQRLMQSASDMLLGWTRGSDKRHYYLRQLRDMKMGAVIEDFDAGDLRTYGRLCGWALARAHARSGDSAMIAGYMGTGAAFDQVIGEFAVAYADQVQKDYRAFTRAVREGRIEAVVET